MRPTDNDHASGVAPNGGSFPGRAWDRIILPVSGGGSPPASVSGRCPSTPAADRHRVPGLHDRPAPGVGDQGRVDDARPGPRGQLLTDGVGLHAGDLHDAPQTTASGGTEVDRRGLGPHLVTGAELPGQQRPRTRCRWCWPSTGPRACRAPRGSSPARRGGCGSPSPAGVDRARPGPGTPGGSRCIGAAASWARGELNLPAGQFGAAAIR